MSPKSDMNWSSLRTSSLLSIPSVVQAPFIIVRIGEYTFGHADKTVERGLLKVTFPDLLQSLNVTKLNGELNTYTISLTYAVTPTRDPNLVEKVLGKISMNREITISYGDSQSPNYIFREEQAIVTNVQTRVNFQSSRMEYTLTAVSKALSLETQNFYFPAISWGKPSDIIKRLIRDESKNITKVFPGMRSEFLQELIAGDDQFVKIPCVPSTNILSYIQTLVECMIPMSGKGYYRFQAFDDVKNKYNGQYFKVVKVPSMLSDTRSLISQVGDMYTINVGYPEANMVSDFQIIDSENWAILYDNAEQLPKEEYTSKLDSLGRVMKNYDHSLTRSSELLVTTAADQAWWNSVTSFPIKATITLKGLARPSILLSYLRLNVMFYGQRHISSGVYFITEQKDSISTSGYQTTLSLVRIPETLDGNKGNN